MGRPTIKGKIQKYKYDLTLILNANSSPIHLEDSVRDITIYNLYEENVFPIIQINLVLNRENFRILQDFAESAKLFLSMNRYALEGTSEGTTIKYSKDEAAPESYLKNEVLIPFDINRTALPLSDGDPEGNTDKTANLMLTINTFLEKHLNLNRTPICNVIIGHPIKDVILYTLNQGGASNVLMNEPQNTKVYEQFLLPGLNMTNTLEYLQEVYGIYENGMDLFFDIKYSYILRKDGNWLTIVPKGGKPNNYKRVYIEINDQKMINPDMEGSFDDEINSRFHITVRDETEFIVMDSSIREINGENIKFFSRSLQNRNIQRALNLQLGVANKGDQAKPVTNTNKPKEILKFNNYDNAFAESEYKSIMSQKLLQLKIPWNNIDLDVLTLNRRYEIVFNNIEYKLAYNGTYKLNSTIYKIAKGKTDNLFDIMGVSVFNKLHKDYFTFGLNTDNTKGGY